MSEFQTPREAKQFIIARIVEEAQREGEPLSERERMLLNFSSQPDEVSEADSDELANDQDEFEKRIARLIKRAAQRGRTDGAEEYNRWGNAVRLVRRQDHYLVVMIDRAGLRPRWDLLKLCATTVGVVAAAVGFIVVLQTFNIDLTSRDAFAFYIWGAILTIAAGYALLRLVAGKKVDDLTNKLFNRMSQR